MHCILAKNILQSFQKGCFGNWALGTWKSLFTVLYCFIQFQCPISEVYHEINQACIIMLLHLNFIYINCILVVMHIASHTGTGAFKALS